MTREVVVVSAVRTAIGTFGGSLKDVPPTELGALVVKESLARASVEGKTVCDKVALVLTDLEMPEMDGFTLTRQIKQDARFHGLPVIIHSSLSGSANEDHVRSVGADGYVAKFVAEDLADAMRRVLPS